MLPRQVRWLAVALALGLMAALTTSFQLALPRLRTDWIIAAVDQHRLLLDGRAGDPWQYRVLSDSLIELLFKALIAAQQSAPYVYGLIGFVLFRGAQEVGIVVLGLGYFRKLGLGLIDSVVGLAIVSVAMLLGQIQTNWQLDIYTDVGLYLLAGMLVLSRRFALVIPVAVLAAFNRETGVFIPFMPLAFVNARAPRSAHNNAMYRAAGISLVLFVAVRVGLRFALPSQDLSTRVLPDALTSSLQIDGPAVYLAIALGTLPFVAALGLRAGNSFLRYLFWLIVPAWIATHAWGNVAMTPLPFLVPLTMVIVPSTLLAAAAARHGTRADFEAAVKDTLAAHWETIAALAVVCLLGPVVAGIVRLSYPFPLERIEGAVLQEVRRVVLGQPLYVAPTLDYVPLVYAPLYMYVSAGVALLTGVSLLPLRIVSFAATLGSTWLVYLLVRTDAPGRLAGFLAAGLFLAATQLTPTDRFPARADALCLLLLLASIYAMHRAEHAAGSAARLSALSGLLIGFAVLTKQTAVVTGLPLLVLAASRPRTRLLPYVAAAGATLAGATGVLLAASDGWARFYLVDLPRNHGVEWSMLTGFWTQHVLPYFWAAVVLAAALVIVRGRRGEYDVIRFYGLTAAGLIGLTWVSVLNPGGGANSWPPAHAGLAMLFGLGFQASLDFLQARQPGTRALPFGVFGVVGLAAVALATVQYSDTQPASLRANARAGQRVVAAIAALPGPVFSPDQEEFQVRAGKGDHAFSAGWRELLGRYGGRPLPEGQQFLAALDEALAQRQYAYVLFDPDGFEPTLKDVLGRRGYARVGPLIDKDDPFYQWRRGFSSGGGYLTPAPDVYAPRSPAP